MRAGNGHSERPAGEKRASITAGSQGLTAKLDRRGKEDRTIMVQ